MRSTLLCCPRPPRMRNVCSAACAIFTASWEQESTSSSHLDGVAQRIYAQMPSRLQRQTITRINSSISASHRHHQPRHHHHHHRHALPTPSSSSSLSSASSSSPCELSVAISKQSFCERNGAHAVANVYQWLVKARASQPRATRNACVV